MNLVGCGKTLLVDIEEVDGEMKKVYGKQIMKEPEKYFTPEVMEKLDVIAQGEFKYGG